MSKAVRKREDLYAITWVVGIIGTLFRAGEGLVQFYSETDYWGLLNLARQYAGASGAEKTSLNGSARIILQTHISRFTYAMILWSIGTLAYSILFVAFGAVPPIIGWLGIVTSVSSGVGYGIKLVKPDFIILLAISSLSAMLFEVCIGVWLLFSYRLIQ